MLKNSIFLKTMFKHIKNSIQLIIKKSKESKEEELDERSKPRSIRRNLSRSFNNLMEGIRSRTPLFSRHATPTRSNKKTTTTIAKTVISSTNIINASSPTPKTSSLCSLSICEGKNKRKMKKKENNESHHLSQQLTSASRSGANIKVRYTNKNNNFPSRYLFNINMGVASKITTRIT